MVKNPEDLQNWNVARSLGSDLLRCFSDYELSFSEVNKKWEDVELPPRPDLMLKVANTHADTRTERINKIARWISTWDEDEIKQIKRDTIASPYAP